MLQSFLSGGKLPVHETAVILTLIDWDHTAHRCDYVQD